MTRNKLRGHPIYNDGEQWRYRDTNEPTVDQCKSRPCGHCTLLRTPEGHDGCLGILPGVLNACCGHGDVGEAYVQLSNGTRFAGQNALKWQRQQRSQKRNPNEWWAKR